jgi:predicted alpha/beta superfamily hydrolase
MAERQRQQWRILSDTWAVEGEMTTRLFALALLLVALPVAAERPKGVELKLDSKILREERRVLVSLPASYKNEDQRYPVLYLLDAEMHLEHTIASADALAAVSRMPELIIVGISHTDRRKDLTPTVTRDAPAAAGGADRFGEFIATELIPEVDRRYRTHPYRLLAGHSFGGLFALSMLFGRPKVFDAWIVVSPAIWWDDEIIVRRAEELSKGYEKPERLYLMSADEDPKIMDGVRRLEQVLTARHLDNLDLVPRNLPDDDHLTSPIHGFYTGLRLAFRPWFFRVDETDDPKTLYSRAQDHYRSLTQRYGFPVPIPAFRYERIVLLLLDRGEIEEAAHVATAFVGAYPSSPTARRILIDVNKRQQ